MSINGALAPAAAVVAVDVGKNAAAALITDAGRHRLLGPLSFSMTAVGVEGVMAGLSFVRRELHGVNSRVIPLALLRPDRWPAYGSVPPDG